MFSGFRVSTTFRDVKPMDGPLDATRSRRAPSASRSSHARTTPSPRTASGARRGFAAASAAASVATSASVTPSWTPPTVASTPSTTRAAKPTAPAAVLVAAPTTPRSP